MLQDLTSFNLIIQETIVISQHLFFWTVLLCIKQDNKRIIYNEIFTFIYIENLRQSGIVWRRYVTNSHRDQRRHLSPHFSWPKQITIIFFKLSRFVQQQFFFFALHFLRFGPTSLISVGHRAGYPIKTVENKDTHTIHIQYWPLWHTFKFNNDDNHYENLRQKNYANPARYFLVGEHGCEYCHYRFHRVHPG